MHLVQLSRNGQRAVAIANGDRLQLLRNFSSVYELASAAIRRNQSFIKLAEGSISGETIDYEPIYLGQSDWHLLCPVDHPERARMMVSGTGLTHKVSAENRAAMHKTANAPVTDSMRMYQLGKDGGQPAKGAIGAQPEWFYKGGGGILRAHLEPLEVPPFAGDGGEEAEIAAAYLIGDDGQPHRIGFMLGNEFSDHVMEMQNYLCLAHSKLRTCSIGPELVTGEDAFRQVTGSVTIDRRGAPLWKGEFYSGEENMCHSLANLEHHHFKYNAHRRPGDLHIHFFGADTFSFGEGVRLEDGDMIEIGASAFGRPLRNPVRIAHEEQQLVRISSLG